MKKLNFKAVSLWEIILSFFAMLLLIWIVIEVVIIPFTKGNTVMQTQLIILLGLTLFLIEFFIHLKRSRDLVIMIDDTQKIVSVNIHKQTINEIKNLSIVKYLFTKSLSSTLIINNKMLLIYKKEALSLSKTKEETKMCKTEIKKLTEIINKSNNKNKNIIFIVPVLINISFYLVLFLALAVFVFMFTAILTGNTHWFNVI